jgi:hypothetical protein
MDINIKQLHMQNHIRRHSAVPYLWRSRCSCGEWFLAATEELARLALETHIASEEPFPDLSLTEEKP